MNGPRYSPQEMLARLVGFDTTSANSNLDLIEFVRGYLAAHGVAAHVLASEDGQKANLFATIGPHERRGIGLSGHTDVVPVTGQKWSSDPFTLTARDGRLYGCGSCDMNCFLAVALALVPDMVAAPLSDPLHLLLSYDEEVGCTGVRGMIEAFGRKLVKPRLIIVGEPTSMQVVDAHKSVQSFTTTVTGVAAHSSMIHLGANAIFAAGEIVRELADLRDEMIAHGDPSGRFRFPQSCEKALPDMRFEGPCPWLVSALQPATCRTAGCHNRYSTELHHEPAWPALRTAGVRNPQRR